jgi:DNA-binding response OmpR family regulator
MRVLIVEDDALVACGLKQGLEHADFVVDHAGSTEIAQHMLSHESPDLAVVDLGLPRADGMELIRWMRENRIQIPVLILTARDGLQDCVDGLNSGADDFMVKPFRLPEVVARVRALIRRSHAVTQSILAVGHVRLDTARRYAQVADAPLELSPREWTILEHLMLASPNVVSKEKLMQQLSGWDKDMTLNAIEVYVSRLRQKLDDAAGVSIRTVRGLGYRLEENALTV